MPEFVSVEDRKAEKAREKGIVHWTIINPGRPTIDRVEIWSEKAQEAEGIEKLINEDVYARIFLRAGRIEKFLSAFMGRSELRQISGTEKLVLKGYSGANPIFQVGSTAITGYTIKKTREWSGYSYAPLKKPGN